MNFALGAMLLLGLLLPGFVFRTVYISTDTLKASIDTTVVNELAFSLFPSMLFNLAGLYAFQIQEAELVNLVYLIQGKAENVCVDK